MVLKGCLFVTAPTTCLLCSLAFSILSTPHSFPSQQAIFSLFFFLLIRCFSTLWSGRCRCSEAAGPSQPEEFVQTRIVCHFLLQTNGQQLQSDLDLIRQILNKKDFFFLRIRVTSEMKFGVNPVDNYRPRQCSALVLISVLFGRCFFCQ